MRQFERYQSIVDPSSQTKKIAYDYTWIYRSSFAAVEWIFDREDEYYTARPGLATSIESHSRVARLLLIIVH
jgi:hypothetical protein